MLIYKLNSFFALSKICPAIFSSQIFFIFVISLIVIGIFAGSFLVPATGDRYGASVSVKSCLSGTVSTSILK